MNIRDLKYLLAIAEHKHFRKAADACFVSQPALSMQIKKLETSLDCQLIERNNKNVLLTEVGNNIVQQAREILDRIDQIKETAKHASDPFSGQLKLGVIPTLAPYLLPHLIPGFSKQFPKLKFYLIEDKSDVLLADLQQGKIDAAILGLPSAQNDHVTTPLFKEEFLLAVPNKHALSKAKQAKLNDIKDETLLLLEEGHCMRQAALEVCFSNNVNESSDFRASSIETLRHMVASNNGLTLMPSLARKKKDGLCYLSLKPKNPSRLIGIAWRHSSPKLKLLMPLSQKIKLQLKGTEGIQIIDK